MRARWLTLLTLLLAAPAWADAVRPMTIVQWLNDETRSSQLVVLGQVAQDAYPNPQTGRVTALLKVGEVLNGPRLGPWLHATILPGYRGGRFLVPVALRKQQWALLFLHSEGGQWVAPPVGRVVETPYHGLTFFPEYNIVLTDAAPGLSWSYVLGAERQIVATRRQIIDGHLPALRAARTKEERDRVKLDIEWQVKDQLGLPLP